MGADIISTPFLDLLLFVYPVYCSAAALKIQDKEKIIQCMTYWITFSVFTTVESFLFFFLRYVPMYFMVKRVFCIWCILPIQNNGGNILYKNIIEKFFAEINQEVRHLSNISLQQVRRTADGMKLKLNGTGTADGLKPKCATTNSVRDFLGETSGLAETQSPIFSGLEKFRGKAEAYRDSVMSKLLKVLGSGASLRTIADAAQDAAERTFDQTPSKKVFLPPRPALPPPSTAPPASPLPLARPISPSAHPHSLARVYPPSGNLSAMPPYYFGAVPKHPIRDIAPRPVARSAQLHAAGQRRNEQPTSDEDDSADSFNEDFLWT